MLAFQSLMFHDAEAIAEHIQRTNVAARILLGEFEEYRSRVQSNSATGYDDVRIAIAVGYARAVLGDLRIPEILTRDRPEVIKESDRINRRTR